MKKRLRNRSKSNRFCIRLYRQLNHNKSLAFFDKIFIKVYLKKYGQ